MHLIKFDLTEILDTFISHFIYLFEKKNFYDFEKYKILKFPGRSEPATIFNFFYSRRKIKI